MAKKIYGVKRNEDLDPSLIKPDVRPLMHKIKDFVTESSAAILLGLTIIIASIIAYNLFYGLVLNPNNSENPMWLNVGIPYYFVDILFGVGLFFTYVSRRNPAKFIFREGLDVENGENWSEKKGLLYFGNDSEGSSIHFAVDDVKTHMLVMGSTGSGKSRFLLGILYQSLLIGSGCCYVDGKGDNTVWWLVYSFCRRVGREDDLLILNYLTGDDEGEEPSALNHQLSNTTNPFSYGNADNLNSLIVGLMREAGGDGAMWKGRARTMLKGLMSALCYKRDKFGLLLDINVIRDYFPLDKIIALSRDVDLKANARDPIRKYLLDLPGFTEESVLTGEIAPKAYEQHNYLTMQLTEVMSDLSETYGKIFGVPLGEIDFKDVLFNRRILFCLLPSLEKDPDALEGLGKLVVAGLRSALAPALGSRVEGLKREVIDTKPTTSKVPFFIILDEYGYYAVQGFAVVAAQARSLGVSVIFAGQDIPSLKKASEEEAKATIANTNIKICMKLEDPDDTAKVYEMRGGQANVAKSEHHENAIFSYTKKGETRLQKEQKIDVRDLVNQDPGEAHVIFRDELSRCRFFYYEPFEVSEVKLNKFIMIDKPKESLILKLKGATKKLDDMFKEKILPDTKVETSDNGLKGLLYDLKWAVQYNDSPEEAAIFGFGMIELRSILKDSSLDSTLQDNRGSGVDLDKGRSDKNELDDEFKQLEQAGDKARTYFNENNDNDDNDESTSEFVSDIDDADINIQLNRMFDSFEAMDDDELLGFFDDDTEDSVMHKNAQSVSDEFSQLLNKSVVNNAKSKGIKGKDIADATSQIVDKEGKKVAENDISMLSESSEYPSGRTPSKMGRDEINNNIREMLSRLDSEKSKIS